MTLPILVPTIGELALAAVPPNRLAGTRRFCWGLTHGALDSAAPRRRFTRPDTALQRQRLVALWSRRIHSAEAPPTTIWTSADSARPNSKAGVTINRTGFRNLLRRCETHLRRLLQLRRESLGVSCGELRRLTESFDLHARVACDPDHQPTLAFVFHAMHWCGHSHPAFLDMPPLHPPTHLVRWIAGFNIRDQVEQGHLIVSLLTQAEARTYHQAAALVAEMVSKAAKTKGTVPLLPELLRWSTRWNT
ncbi:MAG TPA: hypothetical protein VLJ58_10365 [Ramlibacter sp.]|nr:hypothetical protein [Ramlibacter sp.]